MSRRLQTAAGNPASLRSILAKGQSTRPSSRRRTWWASNRPTDREPGATLTHMLPPNPARHWTLFYTTPKPFAKAKDRATEKEIKSNHTGTSWGDGSGAEPQTEKDDISLQ